MATDRERQLEQQVESLKIELGASEAKLGASEAKLGASEAKLGASEAKLGLTEAELTKSKNRCDVLRQLRENLDSFVTFAKERDAMLKYSGGCCTRFIFPSGCV